MSYQVRFVAKKWDNHSAHSGYHQLVNRLGTAVLPLNLSSIRYTLIPGRFAAQMAARSGISGYGYEAFFHEWAAYREMVTRRMPTVYHVLYGDESFRYLGQFPVPKRHRIVVSYHQPPDYLSETIRSPSYLGTADAVIVVGTNQIPFFTSVVDPNRLFWVPHGVDTTAFKPSSTHQETITHEMTCLFVGMHKRDLDTLARVIEIVGHAEPRAVFKIVTAKSNADRFVSYSNVRLFHGVPENELVSLYQDAAMLIQPLVDSTANNAVLEGMACGLPIIATDVGGIRDYVNEQCAVLTPSQDARQMAKSILDLLADKPRRTEMGLQARANSLQFDWDVVVSEMRRVYESIMSGRI